MMVGERGILMHDTYGRNPKLFPESLEAEAAAVPQSYPRIKDSHQMNWVKACKEGRRGVEPLRVCVTADRGHATRRRGAAGRPGKEDPLRRRCHADHQRGRGEPVPHARVPGGVGGLTATTNDVIALSRPLSQKT